MTETVSVIIATRNRAPILTMCLEALGQQQTNGFTCEVIVVDDCSVDATEAVVRKFASTHRKPTELIRQPRPLGANAARNRGIQMARGEAVVLLDDDALAPDNWLQELVTGLSQSGCPVVSGPVKLRFDGHIPWKHQAEVGSLLAEVLVAPRGFRGEVVPLAGNMAALRSVFGRAKFDETLRPPMEETDWLWRAGVEAAFVPEAWVWHYKTRDDLRTYRMLRGAWNRGGEGGWWMREKLQMPLANRRREAFRGIRTCARAAGHAAVHMCWGGAVVAASELSKASALLGLTNRGKRSPGSWR